MGEPGATRRLSRVWNIVHNDEIWKDHVRHETVSARQKWPDTWGYLIREYKAMKHDLEEKPTEGASPSSGDRVATTPTEGIKLPKIPDRLRTYPKTTSQEIGWKSTQGGQNAEMVTRYGEVRQGKCTFIRRLKWPKDGVY